MLSTKIEVDMQVTNYFGRITEISIKEVTLELSLKDIIGFRGEERACANN